MIFDLTRQNSHLSSFNMVEDRCFLWRIGSSKSSHYIFDLFWICNTLDFVRWRSASRFFWMKKRKSLIVFLRWIRLGQGWVAKLVSLISLYLVNSSYRVLLRPVKRDLKLMGDLAHSIWVFQKINCKHLKRIKMVFFTTNTKDFSFLCIYEYKRNIIVYCSRT